MTTVLCRDVFVGDCDVPLREEAGKLVRQCQDVHLMPWEFDEDTLGLVPDLDFVVFAPHARPEHLLGAARGERALLWYLQSAPFDIPGWVFDEVLRSGMAADPVDMCEERSGALRRAGDEALLRRHAAGGVYLDPQGVAGNPNCPEDLLWRLACDDSPNVRQAAYENPSAPASLVEAGTRDPDPRTAAAALRRTTDLVALAAAASRTGEGDQLRRQAVAENPHWPAERLWEFAGDPDEGVLGAVVRREDCPRALVARLATSGPRWARSGAARHSDLPPALLPVLAASGAPCRAAVARRPDCPQEVLAALARDESAMVRAHVAARQDFPLEAARGLAEDRSSAVRARVARRADCPADLAARFAEDPDEAVRRAVARRPDCPPALLVRLAGDAGEQTRELVARRPDCPPEALELLAGDTTASVLVAVAEHPGTPSGCLARLAEAVRALLAWEAAQAVERDDDGLPRFPRRVFACRQLGGEYWISHARWALRLIDRRGARSDGSGEPRRSKSPGLG